MSNGLSQPTLQPSQPDLDGLVRSLGLAPACTWCALERSTSLSAPIAFGSAPVQDLTEKLQALAVMHRTATACADVRRSLYDPVRWSYTTPWSDYSCLEASLSRSLLGAWEGSTVLDRINLWRWLAASESAHYLSYLLRKHQISVERAFIVIYALGEDWTEHSLGRQRYLAWAGVRAAAGALLQSGMDQEYAQSIMIDEMRRRSRWLHQRAHTGTLGSTDFCFVPDGSWRKPIVFDVVMELMPDIGSGYWLNTPESLRSSLHSIQLTR